MSRYTGPIRKKQRKYGLIPSEEKAKSYKAAKPKRKSEFAVHLDEKQKIKFIYGVQERQFQRYMKMAFRDKAQTGVRKAIFM